MQIADCKLLIAAGAAAIASITLGAQARPQPGTKLTLDQVKAQMFHVSAGKRLKPKAWPNGALLVVVAAYFLTRNHGVLDA